MTAPVVAALAEQIKALPMRAWVEVACSEDTAPRRGYMLARTLRMLVEPCWRGAEITLTIRPPCGSVRARLITPCSIADLELWLWPSAGPQHAWGRLAPEREDLAEHVAAHGPGPWTEVRRRPRRGETAAWYDADREYQARVRHWHAPRSLGPPDGTPFPRRPAGGLLITGTGKYAVVHEWAPDLGAGPIRRIVLPAGAFRLTAGKGRRA